MDKLINFFKDAIQELKKITWPTKKETTNYTILVLAMTTGLALFLGGLDWLFNSIVMRIVAR